LKSRHQEWCPGLNIILGPNGSGKTNLLESLNVLCGWGAFEGGKLSSLVAWDSADVDRDNRAFIAGRAEGEREVEVEAKIGARASLRAGNERVTHSALRALLPSLSFLPGNIGLLDGSPGVRRFFLDKLCALCSPLYARRLAEYKLLVRHRTRALGPGPVMGVVEARERALPLVGVKALEATAVPLTRFGGWIRDVRRRAVALLAEKLSSSEGEERNLLPCKVELSMLLQGTFGGAQTAEDAAKDMEKALNASLERERHARMVLVGPHRDDLLFTCLGRPASLALSRGQKRRVVMAVILAAGRLIEEKLRLKPILILDDITAELDTEGRELTGAALAETGWQVFATAADTGEPGKNSAPFGSLPDSAFCLRHIRAGQLYMP
jgi:DNA replication and repair protein RecF